MLTIFGDIVKLYAERKKLHDHKDKIERNL